MKRHGTILIYGRHAVEEALAHRSDIVRDVYLSENVADTALTKRITGQGIPITRFKSKQPPRGVDKDAVHQGVIATISESGLTTPYKPFISDLSITPDTALLILGEVQDPHNVGSVIRSAAAFGIAGVLIPPHRQAQITGSVIKVSAGMAFRVPLVSVSNVNTTLRDLKERGFWAYGLAGDGGTALPDEQFSKPSVFVLGNEGEGLRKVTREVCDELLSIPQSAQCESLNAATSAAIVLYGWASQHPDALT